MTSIDLLGAIALTASAATLVGSLASHQTAIPAGRTRFVLAFAGWFLLVVISGATGLLSYPQGLGTPGLGVAVALPIIVLVYVAMRRPGVHQALQAMPVPLLIGVHAVRLLGVFFVLLYAQHRLPGPFAPIAGWGDIAVGAAALPVAWAAARRLAGWRSLALLWNSLGLLDLLAAVGLGVASAEGSPVRIFFGEPSSLPMTSLPWLLIPAFLVPLLFVVHLAIYYRLALPQERVRLAHS